MAATLPPVAARAQSITDVGVLPGFNRTHIVGLSADGTVAAGYCSAEYVNPRVPPHAFRWTRAGGIMDLGISPSPTDGLSVTALSLDGSAVIGQLGSKSFRWTQAQGVQVFEVANGSMAAGAVNGDGTRIVGSLDDLGSSPWTSYAFVWTPTTGFAPLAGWTTFHNTDTSIWTYIYGDVTMNGWFGGMSADGSVVVGTGQRWLWHSDLGGYFSYAGSGVFIWQNGQVTFLPGNYTPLALSADGSTFVGSAGGTPFRWRTGAGFSTLPVFGSNPGVGTSTLGLSGDGSVVVGSAQSAGNSNATTAAMWIDALGVVDLNQYLPAHGVNMAGVGTLYSAPAISADGSTIAVENYAATRSWIVTLPRRCASDLDNGSVTGTPDGGVDINDLLFFLSAFGAGNSAADLDNASNTGTPDGGVDVNDLLFFLTHFEAGC